MRPSLPQAPRRIQAVSQHLLIQVKQPNSGCNVRLSGQPGEWRRVDSLTFRIALLFQINSPLVA